jgi:hypothetical protein
MVTGMGVFRYDTKYAAPTKEQRERYMKGEYEEHHFGEENEIMLIVYDEAVYLKDETDGSRVLFTGPKDKEKVYDEVKRRLDEHAYKGEGSWSFVSAREIT